MARQVIAAPPSASAAKKAKLVRTRTLRDKANRTPQESQELIDNLLSLLPTGTL